METRNNPTKILANTISQYLEKSDLADFKIEHKVLKIKASGIIYLIKVGKINNNFSYHAVRQYRNKAVKLGDEIIETLDELFTHMCKE